MSTCEYTSRSSDLEVKRTYAKCPRALAWRDAQKAPKTDRS